MNLSDSQQQKIEAYLFQLSSHLQDLPQEEVCDIVDELHSHILDRLATNEEIMIDDVAAVLTSLGNPKALAGQYQSANRSVLKRKQRSSIGQLWENLFFIATTKILGSLLLITSLASYAICLAFIIWAILKVVYPHTAGLWISNSGTDDLMISLNFGLGTAPVGGKEILGWWLIPIGLILGSANLILTTRFLLWVVRIYRNGIILPKFEPI